MNGEFILGHPFWLMLLPVPWLLARRIDRNREDRLARLLAPSLRALLIRPRPGGGRARLSLLFITAWSLALLAASDPQRIDGGEERHMRRGPDLAIVVDISPSMNAADIAPSRLARARFELLEALPRLRGGRLALVTFSAQAYPVLPLTADVTVVAHFVAALESGLTRRHGSNLTMALETAADLLKDSPPGGRAILLISDGESHERESVRAAAARLGRRGIPVLAMGIGTPGGAPVPGEGGRFLHHNGKVVISTLDASLLREVGRASNGLYIPMREDDRDWDMVMNTLDGLSAPLREAAGNGKAEHFYPWCLAAALALFLLAAPGARLPRPPASLSLLFLLLPAASPLPASPWQAQAAHEALDRGDYTQAARLFEKTGGFLGALGRGVAAYRQERWDIALSAFREAASLAEDDDQRVLAAYDLGTTLLRLGHLGEAENALRLALRLRPDYRAAAINLALLREARRGSGAGDRQDRAAQITRDGGGVTARTAAGGSTAAQGSPASPAHTRRGRPVGISASTLQSTRIMLRMRMAAEEADHGVPVEEQPW
ncbi:MAG TPA: VWA domain-containing protein [Gammaproteobacteria bacterium]|nr:VWA domain-containing protein [Gammaproteobacteria bacterium]